MGRMIIQQLLSAMEKKDFVKMAACFSQNGKLFDYGPSCNGKDNYFVYGSGQIEMFYRNRFVHNHYSIAQVRIEDEKSATYFASYDGPYVYVKLEIEQLDKDGLVLKAVAHPC